MNLSERKTAFVVAMHAVTCTRPKLPGDLIDSAQKHTEFGTAMRALFKRLPNTTKLGRWLHEHIGFAAGEFKLYGQYSRRASAWKYCVLSASEAEALERARVEKAAARDAKLNADIAVAEAKETKRIGERRAATAERIRKLQARQPKGEIRIASEDREAHTIRLVGQTESTGEPGRDFTVKVSPDGQVIREPVRGRDGRPLGQKPGSNPSESPESATPKQMNVTERTAHDSRLPLWVREGRQPTRQELAAQHGRLFPSRAVSGFADPGGVITANQNAGRATVHVCRPISGRW